MGWAKAKIAITTALVLACAVGGGVGVYTHHSKHLKQAGGSPGASHVITLSNGTKLTLLGTSFGNHHMAPGYEKLRTANWINTPSNTTVLWIKEEPQAGRSYELLVSDEANTGCVSLEAQQESFVKPGVSLQGFVLSAYPRWDEKTIVRVRPYRGAVVPGEFVLTNPSSAPPAPLMPKPLPDTESDSNLEVTLVKLIAGAPLPHDAGKTNASAGDPANQCVHLDFDFRVDGRSTTNWAAWPVQTTDAFGNQSHGLIYRYPTNGLYPVYPDRIHPSFPLEYDGYYFQPGLWPDEPWKVRLEFIQQSGFSADDMLTLTNLPVKLGNQQDANDEWNAWNAGKTNFPHTITPATVNGVHLKVLPPLLLANRWQTNEMDISVILGADPGFRPKGMNLTVVSATDNQGRDLWSFERPAWAGHYSISFARVHDDVKSLNLKLALHKSRFVEFTVKPEKAKVDTVR